MATLFNESQNMTIQENLIFLKELKIMKIVTTENTQLYHDDRMIKIEYCGRTILYLACYVHKYIVVGFMFLLFFFLVNLLIN